MKKFRYYDLENNNVRIPLNCNFLSVVYEAQRLMELESHDLLYICINGAETFWALLLELFLCFSLVNVRTFPLRRQCINLPSNYIFTF